MSKLEINAPNLWRLETPGRSGWSRSARPGDPNKYFMISADCHANEPVSLWAERIDTKYRDRLPRVTTDANGVQWRVSEGHRPDRIRVNDLEGEDMLRQKAGADPKQRLLDQDMDGIDAEIIYPNKGLSMWATPDAIFAQAQCRVFNEWAWEQFGAYNDRLSPVAAIATADLEGSIKEVQRVAKVGFRALTLPCKPVWGAHDIDHANYNLPAFDPLWAAIQDTLALADGGARGQPLRLRGARALPGASLRHDRGRHRLAAVGARRDGRGVQEAPLLGPPQAQAPAERVLPRARLCLVPGGRRWTGARRALQPDGQLHVGQ